MTEISSIKLIELSLSLEYKKLEAATRNLTNINKTFVSKNDFPGEFYLRVRELPNIEDVIKGLGGITTYSINADKTKVKTESKLGSLEYRVALDLETETLNISQAKNAYEASIRLFNNSKDMSRKVMTIGNK
ncbi:hypothetical protein AAFX15_22145 [Vibrio chagasii]|uniref:hypothetical protein n=1 Tax=Vibrio chagasii TaxID=170679 RepID=UPI0038CDDA6C